MITPTIGRVVWFYHEARRPPQQPYAALVAYVHSDHCVNLAYFDENGVARNATSITLVQEEAEPPGWSYCCWMPYQIGQAKKEAR